MYTKAWILAWLTIFSRNTESLSMIYSINQRGFEFPDDSQPTPADINDINGLEGRQGTTLPGFPTSQPVLTTLPGFPSLPVSVPSTAPGVPVATPVVTPIATVVNPVPVASIVTGQTCICVPTGTCTSTGSPDGSGLIDIRIVTNLSPAPTVLPGTTIPTTAPLTSCIAGLVLCCQPGPYQCGVRYPPIATAPVPAAGQAPYGSYPWQAVLLAPGDVYLGSGVLLNNLNVLTVAHRASQFVNAPTTLKVRMGEWNSGKKPIHIIHSIVTWSLFQKNYVDPKKAKLQKYSRYVGMSHKYNILYAEKSIFHIMKYTHCYKIGGANEPIPAQEFIVSRIFLHPNYNAANLKNDVAILRLATPVPLGNTPTVATGCLPATSFVGSRCFVSGWGRNDFVTGTFQTVQKQVDVPILQSTQCQSTLAATRLGPTFVFDPVSFLCAGGEAGKDACTGDGGSPLMCAIGNRWFIAGLVAWGIGCGTTNVPGVYVNVASYVPWIQTTVST